MSDCCHDLGPMPADVDVLHVSRGVSRRALLRAMAASAGLTALGGFSGGAFAQGKKVRLAFCSQLLCVMPYEITRAGGFFAAEGLDVELVYTRGGSAALQALNGGAVAYAATSFDAAINAYSNGANIVRFATTGRLPLFALATSPQNADTLTDLAGLEGATVAVSALGNADHFLTVYLLQRAGVDPSTVRFATIGTNLYDALRIGQVDAGMVQEPALSLLQQDGARVLVNLMDIDDARQYLGGPYEFMGVSVRPGEIEQRREEMQALARGLAAGLKYLQEAPPADLVEALPPALMTGGDPKAVARTLERYRASLYPTSVAIDLDAMRRVLEVHRRTGIGGDDTVTLDEIANTSIVKS